MRVMYKTIVAGGLLACASFANAAEESPLSANVAATSNYIWRGVSQSGESAAVSGGIDFSKAGFYAGTWASNIAGGATAGNTEVDLYAGFGGEIGAFGYDVGVISYQYPQADPTLPSPDFDEFYVGGSYGIFSAKYSSSSDVGDYLEAAVTFDLGKERSLALHYGDYDIDQGSTHPFAGPGVKDYSDYSISLSKGDWSFAISDTDLSNDDYRVYVTWSKELSL